MKRKFEKAQAQIVDICVEDIITTSTFWGDLEEDESKNNGN